MNPQVLAFLVFLVFSVSCRTADEWKSRTIYQLLTDRFARTSGSDGCGNLGYYCGGTYRGIINNLDYIQGMGFDAIWISPIIDNYNGGYHGYWGRNMFRLNDNFGTQQDFKDFVSACHSRGIWVMVDVVGNHMGNTDQNYGSNTMFNDGSHYHDYCIISDNDFNTYNQNRIENCRLAGLADLKQENDYVRTTLLDWISQLVRKYDIDGLRVDTVPEVPKWFWKQFTDSAGVYTVGQVFNGNMGYVGGYVNSVRSVLNYPFFYWVRDTLFNNKDMTNLRQFYSEWSRNIDPRELHYMANFVDNHDNARWLSWSGDWESKKKVFKTGHVLTLTTVGIPIVYYGSEQYFAGGNDPNNRQILWRNLDRGSEMYLYIQKVVEARKKFQIWNYDQIERYADSDIFAFSRGKFLVVTTNKLNAGVSRTISYHPFSNGQVICNIFWPTTDCITVNGSFQVYLLNGEAKIYVPR